MGGMNAETASEEQVPVFERINCPHNDFFFLKVDTYVFGRLVQMTKNRRVC